MIKPPFPSTSEAQLHDVTFLTIKKTWSENSIKTTVTQAHVLRQGSACARGGGGSLDKDVPYTSRGGGSGAKQPNEL